MTFGSRWGRIQPLEVDPTTGLRIAPDSPIHSVAFQDEKIEAPLLYRRGNDSSLFVNRGFCCRGSESTYEIRIGRSGSITGPYLDSDGGDGLPPR